MKLRHIVAAFAMLLGANASYAGPKCNVKSCIQDLKACVDDGKTGCSDASKNCIDSCAATNSCVKQCSTTVTTAIATCQTAYNNTPCILSTCDAVKVTAKDKLKVCTKAAQGASDSCQDSCK